MSVESVGDISVAPTLASSLRELPATNNQLTFKEVLLDGAMKVDANQQLADQAVQAFAIGSDIPPHQVMMALEQARMSLHFALQVRSRLVEGYQELMRMQL